MKVEMEMENRVRMKVEISSILRMRNFRILSSTDRMKMEMLRIHRSRKTMKMEMEREMMTLKGLIGVHSTKRKMKKNGNRWNGKWRRKWRIETLSEMNSNQRLERRRMRTIN